MTLLLQISLLVFLAKDLHGATYSIVHPKLFRIDTDEKVVVNLHGYGNTQVDILAWFTDHPKRRNIFGNQKVAGNARDSIAFNMKVTRADLVDAVTIDYKKVELEITIKFRSSVYSQIQKKVIVYLNGKSDYIFVQTERPIYRPGEAVQIRVVPLDSAMLPLRLLPSDANTVKITVQNADGVGIWKDQQSFPVDDFLVSEYTIPIGAALGTYYVSAKIKSKLHLSVGKTKFKIDKYVLPMYNVEVKLKDNTVAPIGFIEGTLKATYRYGEPIVGTYTSTAILKVPGRLEMTIYNKSSAPYRSPGILWEHSQGTAPIKIPISQATAVTEMSWDELIEARATVSLNVSVVGENEGIAESVLKEGILITNTPYVIDVTHTSKYFVPGMIQDINVIVRNVVSNERVPDVPIKVFKGKRQVGGIHKCDEKGAIAVPIETTSVNEIEVSVETAVKSLSAEEQAKMTLTLHKFASNYGYLRMSAPSHATVNSTAFVRFRTSSYTPNEIFYVVSSKGAIVLTGKHARSESGDFVQSIRITRKMSPSIRVVGYFVNDLHVVSDSLSIVVDEACTSEELTITLESDEVRPGAAVRLTYKGQPGALIGTSAVDRAAYFLNNEGRLDREQMFGKMKLFDTGCSVLGGEDSFNVFEEAGLALATPFKDTPSKPDLNCTDEFSYGGRGKRSARRKHFKEGQDTLYSGRITEVDDSSTRLKRTAKNPIRSKRHQEFDFSCGQQVSRGNQVNERCVGCLNDGTVSAFTATDASQQGERLDIGSHTPDEVRLNFEEALLFNSRFLDQHGHVEQSFRAPDSITAFEINAISLHKTEGFCVAKPVRVKVFKDFFIQLYLPYSAKVMQQVQIRAAVFNNHKTRCRTVKLKIKGDENLCMAGSPGKWSDVATLKIEKESSKSFIFSAIAMSVPEQGYSKIQLNATSTNDPSASDVIVKKLKIEESGNEEEFSGSFELNPDMRVSRQIKFEFPNTGVLQGTRRCWIHGHMNFLGPVVEFDTIEETPRNLDDLLRLPLGNGENNMEVVGPNVYIFEYLSYRNHAAARSQSKIKRYVIDGYTRQLIHRNGKRWSLWSWYNPNTWLNAYVNKVFLSAREVWGDLDIEPICDSFDWLISTQRSDGSFYEYYPSPYRRTNVDEDGEVALTAHVLIAFAENGPIDCRDRSLKSRILQAKDKAFNYLKRTVDNDKALPYIAAITAYAMALVNERDIATQKAHQRLLKSKLQSPDSIFWKGRTLTNNRNTLEWYRTNPEPIDIETTAYALITEVSIAATMGNNVSPSIVDRINMIARWMVSQNNDRRRWTTYQTKSTAIQSMTIYAKWNEALKAPPRNAHLNLRLTSERRTSWQNGHSFTLDENNEFYRKEQEIPTDVLERSRTINVAITAGEGKGSLSYRCVYRQIKNSDICDFNIIATTSTVRYRGPDDISKAAPDEEMNVIKIDLAISKTTPGDSGVAIIDISMISGFRPVRSSIVEIVHAANGIIKADTQSAGKIKLYVNKIPGSDNRGGPLRFGFKMQQHVQVNNPNPAKIVVYEYYEPKATCSKFYAVPGNSPMVRMSCSLDRNNEQQCRCAEGACPMCRTRQEQLLKTCDENVSGDCLNLRNEICKREYGMFAEVVEIDDTSVPLFIKLRARIDEIFFSKLSDEILKNQTRTFVIRRDCYQNCKDESLYSLDNPTYFAVGQTFLNSGKQPERILKSGNQESFEYYLDDIGLIERTVSATKCDKFKRKWERKCEHNPEAYTHCKKVKLCQLQDDMIKKVKTGCD